MDSKKMVVPLEIQLNGDASQNFLTCKKTDGSVAFVVKGDGSVVSSSELQSGGSLGAVASSDATLLGFYGVTQVTKPTALTTKVVAAASFTHTAPGTPDYLIQDLTSSSPFGFVTKDEGNSVLKTLQNAIKRIEDLETKLQALGLLA